MDFLTVSEQLIDWVVRVGQTVNDLPGTAAFALGLFTWFAVEQVLRRVMMGLRWIIVVGVLAGLGFSVPYVANLLLDRGGATPSFAIEDAIEEP